MTAYFNGQYLPKESIAISPDDRGFLFADSIYEVIRSYNGKLFKIDAHLKRLSYGASELKFNRTDFYYIQEVAENLINKNNLKNEDATVYIQITRGIAPRTHFFPSKETALTVYACANSFMRNKKIFEEGINVILVKDLRWARCNIKTVGLTANVLANEEAKDKGALEALFVRDGAVLEGSHSSFFAVIDGIVITAPRSNYILDGISRQVVLELCKNQSMPYKERPVLETEIGNAEELMITGTTTEITPIVKINGKKIGSGKPGIITRKLQTAFKQVIDNLK